MYMQVDRMKNFYYGEIEVSIFLREDVSSAAHAINQAIDTSPLVRSKTYETREQAFEKFKVLCATRPTSSTRSARTACPSPSGSS
jgi:cell division transport system permease protein